MKTLPVHKRRKEDVVFKRRGPQSFWEDPLVLAWGLQWRQARDGYRSSTAWARKAGELIRSLSDAWKLPYTALLPRAVGAPTGRKKAVASSCCTPVDISTLQPHPQENEWQEDGVRFRLVVDCQVLAGLVNGTTPLLDESYRPPLRRMAASLDRLLQRGLRPPRDWDDPVCRRERSWNRQVDWVANRAMDAQQEVHWVDQDIAMISERSYVLLFSDGGFRRGTGRASAGFAAYVRDARVGDTRLVAFKGCPPQNIHSAFHTEVVGLEMSIDFLMQHSAGAFAK